MTSATFATLYSPQAQLQVSSPFIVCQSGKFIDTSHYPCENIRSWFLPLTAHVCSSHHRASPSPCLLNTGYPGSKGCASSALLILSRLTFFRHVFPRPFCCSITSSSPSHLNPSLIHLMPFFPTVHHSFCSTSKQTRAESLAQRPPWGPSALWKTLGSHNVL